MKYPIKSQAELVNFVKFLKKLTSCTLQHKIMPIVLKRIEKDYSIGIWQSTESFDELLSIEPLNLSDLEKWHAFKSDKRKREWLTVRVLIKKLFQNGRVPTINYDGFGKPILDNRMGVSISHTKEFVAILITSKANAGIDLETLRERIVELSGKFANEQELSSVPEVHLVEYLHVLWGAKEVLYKLYGRGEIDFRGNLHVDPFSYSGSGDIIAWIRTNNLIKKHNISYECWQEMMRAYSVAD